MDGKIGLEEHFAIDDTLNDFGVFLPDRVWPELSARLLDFGGKRIAYMDRHGVEIMVLSLNAPAVQADYRSETRQRDCPQGQRRARRAGRETARSVCCARGAADAGSGSGDAGTASAASTELGFCGALANGFSQVNDANTAVYYDLPQYRPFWAAVERLDVPFYLHPRNPLPAWAQIYEGHEWLLGPTWAFGVETATHALRLMGSGPVRRMPATADRSRPYGRGAALQHLARR